jgi:type III secretory pathway component EscS
VSGEHAAFGGVTNVNEHVTGSCMHTLQTWTSSHEGMREVQPTGWLVGAILARTISGVALAAEALLASIHSVGGIISCHQLDVHVQSSSLEPAMKLVGVCRCMHVVQPTGARADEDSAGEAPTDDALWSMPRCAGKLV